MTDHWYPIIYKGKVITIVFTNHVELAKFEKLWEKYLTILRARQTPAFLLLPDRLQIAINQSVGSGFEALCNIEDRELSVGFVRDSNSMTSLEIPKDLDL